ncbi:MAG: Hsp20/alpha crystallin family protein [Candidatus Rokuibacteriota bacterium]
MAVDRSRPFRFEGLDPFRDLVDMQSEVNRAFDAYFGRQTRPGAVERVWAPAVDIYETKDDLVVTAEVPGVKEKDVHLSIVGDMLSLRGQRVAENQVTEEKYHRVERWSGSFERHIQLPIPVQADKVRATYRDGVLEVRLPKVDAVKPREIKIELG